jgi:hypothetical protein
MSAKDPKRVMRSRLDLDAHRSPNSVSTFGSKSAAWNATLEMARAGKRVKPCVRKLTWYT